MLKSRPSAADDTALERPSKTQLKQQMLELQRLGHALSELPADRLLGLELPERLLDAVTEFKRTRSHEGRRRQLQYVGKLMRGVDPEPLRAAVDAFALGSAVNAMQLHEAERWRVELVRDDEAITRWTRYSPTATCNACVHWCAPRATTRPPPQANATAAAGASCSSSSNRTSNRASDHE